MVNLFTGVFENPYILALKKEIAMSSIRMQNRNNRPTYKEMDNTYFFRIQYSAREIDETMLNNSINNVKIKLQIIC